MVSVRKAWIAALGLALAACAEVGPDYRVPPAALANAPAASGAFVAGATAASNAPLPARWWRLYDDPALDALIERALASNVDLRAAQANLERSSALLAAARTAREPSAGFDASTNYTQQSAAAVLSHVEPPRHEIYNIGFTMSYDLDLFGGIRRGIEAASADHEAVATARDLVRVNVAAEVARAYSDLCNAGNRIDVLQRAIALQQQRLALTRQLIANGRAPSFEAQRDSSAIDDSRAALAPLQARRLNAAFRLATLMGEPPENYDRALLSCRKPLELAAPIPSGDGRALLARRPDVRAAERRLAASTARIGVETAALYPDIKLGASIGSTGGAAAFLTPLTNRFAVGPMVTWDLHRSAIRDRIDAARADSRASLAHFDATVLTALRETETSLNTYAAALERLQRLQAARDAARDVMERTDELRHGGRVGGLVALDARRTWLAAETAVAAARQQVNDDQIATFLALGGGWQ
ncbi:transporter [Burkholderia vietnamiensis]|uniref:efflux transporter outer membrane subunit n=1 Tax=Burkholderia vietnamiensis TaxID=60552 RepID=UPI000621D815|nr:TolC family protein [Burkholderia vietnamiensis]KKI37565.1 transporter [Burkholderia vietnamiensis]MDN8041520.1 TolC family protein [Burkholderia vietnamiensis]HDR9072378.1 TolC family protein [Burkholderia vietnamiensis]HDR9129172.1 TolC family protein [Burkholderia vietnamiensis]